MVRSASAVDSGKYRAENKTFVSHAKGPSSQRRGKWKDEPSEAQSIAARVTAGDEEDMRDAICSHLKSTAGGIGKDRVMRIR